MVPSVLCVIGVFLDLVSIWARATADREEDRQRIHFAGAIFYLVAFFLNRSLGNRGAVALTGAVFGGLFVFFLIVQGLLPWLMVRRGPADK